PTTAVPTPTPASIIWTEASLNEDWPGPLRAEPPGRPIELPILLKVVVHGTNCPGECSSTQTSGHLADPTGDTGSDAVPWADIVDVGFCMDTGTCLHIGLLSDPPAAVVPTEQWIAYGVVTDTDGDGVPDWRYGIDNAIVTAGCADPAHRVWRTDLHADRTESMAD